MTTARLTLASLVLAACGSRALPPGQGSSEPGDGGSTRADGGSAPGDASSTAADASSARVPWDAAPPDAALAACFGRSQPLTIAAAAAQVALSIPLSVEWGDPSRLTPTELAGRLARLVWRADADPALIARITGCGGALTNADVGVLVEQMLADPRAVRGLEAFFSWWLGLDALERLVPDQKIFPVFSPALRQSMIAEPKRFGVHVVLEGDGRFPTLLTGRFSFVDGQLAQLYGMPQIALDAPFARVAFGSQSRAGLLTQPAILARNMPPTRNSPPSRASFILDRILCQPLPPPPPSFPPPLPPSPPGQSLRATLEGMMNQPSCRSCHTLLTIGYAYEPFDALGRQRAIDNGAPIDARIVLTLPGSGERFDVDGPVEAAARLAAAPGSAVCFARKWLEFALEREIIPEDEGSLRAAVSVFTGASLNVRALIAGVARTAVFLAPR